MTDADPQNADTPTEGQGGTQEPEVDYRKRYEDLHPEYTRTTQELAKFRRIEAGEDAEGFEKLLNAYGYELADDAPVEDEPVEEEYEPDTDAEDPRLSRFDQFMQQQEEQQRQQAAQEQWDGWTQFIAGKAADVELTPYEMKALQFDCVGQDGMPIPPAQAEKVLNNYLDARNKWLDAEASKRTRPRVPHVNASGQPETGGKDVADMTLAERDAYAIARLHAEQA